MSLAVAPDHVALSCNHCPTRFSVNRADMTEAEWISGASDRLIRDAAAAGWSGGKRALIHLCPSCSLLPED